jgi:predicted nucleic acid-binding protein
MTLTRYDHVPLLGRIWELRHNMWPYDAAYVALAESLRVDLVTVDSKLGSVPGLKCIVRNLRDE